MYREEFSEAGEVGLSSKEKMKLGAQWLWLWIVGFKKWPPLLFQASTKLWVGLWLETPSYLFTVLADIGVDLVEGAQHIELCGVQAGLLREVGIHILVTNGWELGNICIVSATDRTGP